LFFLGWQIDLPDLEKSVSYAKDRGVKIKAMVVINPGNPTGQILSEETIRGIIKFCYNNKIAILADEVYQENVYKKGAKFFSFRKVMQNMEHPFNTVDLFSFHSTSKGLIGECGIRGGFIKLTNIQTEVYIIKKYDKQSLFYSNFCFKT
jgi:aspartate/methionine/tyrosine aminotransferase